MSSDIPKTKGSYLFIRFMKKHNIQRNPRLDTNNLSFLFISNLNF